MIRKKHELMVEGNSKDKVQASNKNGSRFSHHCPSPRYKELPPVKGAYRTKGWGRGWESDGVTEIFIQSHQYELYCLNPASYLLFNVGEIPLNMDGIFNGININVTVSLFIVKWSGIAVSLWHCECWGKWCSPTVFDNDYISLFSDCAIFNTNWIPWNT